MPMPTGDSFDPLPDTDTGSIHIRSGFRGLTHDPLPLPPAAPPGNGGGTVGEDSGSRRRVAGY